MTVESVFPLLEPLLPRVQKPIQYVGGELHATTKAIIDVLVKGEVPVGPSNSIFLSGGVGPNLPRTGPDADE